MQLLIILLVFFLFYRHNEKKGVLGRNYFMAHSGIYISSFCIFFLSCLMAFPAAIYSAEGGGRAATPLSQLIPLYIAMAGFIVAPLLHIYSFYSKTSSSKVAKVNAATAVFGQLLTASLILLYLLIFMGSFFFPQYFSR